MIKRDFATASLAKSYRMYDGETYIRLEDL